MWAGMKTVELVLGMSLRLNGRVREPAPFVFILLMLPHRITEPGSVWVREQSRQLWISWCPLEETVSVTELFALPRSVLHHQLKSSVTKSGFLLSSGLSPVIFIRQEQWPA